MVIPACLMLGSSPQFLAIWAPLRLLTAALPQSVYTWADDCLFSTYQRFVIFFFEHFTGTEIHMYGDTTQVQGKKENVIYISNHQSTVDWVVSEMVALRHQSLGQVRYILKDGLRYFPMYGFYFRQHSCIYVNRNKSFNEGRAVSQLEELKELPYWLVIFPEGTRFSPDSIETKKRTRKFAEDNGLPLLDEVFTPRSKATWLSLHTLREQTDALYDVTIAYSGTMDSEGKRKQSPGLPEFLQRSNQEIHVHVKRFDVKDIPLTDETTFRAWLANRFQEKDRLLKRFYSVKPGEKQSLGDDGHLSTLPIRHTLPAFAFWMALLAPLMLTSSGRIWYAKMGLSGTALGMLWMMIRK